MWVEVIVCCIIVVFWDTVYIYDQLQRSQTDVLHVYFQWKGLVTKAVISQCNYLAQSGLCLYLLVAGRAAAQRKLQWCTFQCRTFDLDPGGCPAMMHQIIIHDADSASERTHASSPNHRHNLK